MSFFTNSDWYVKFTVRDSVGDPVDLTGKTLQLSLRARSSSPDTLVDLSTTAGTLVITDGPGGQFAVDVPHSSLAGVPAGEHYWDLVDDAGNGRQVRLAGGRWLVRQGITA